jgi:hypothetical protein
MGLMIVLSRREETARLTEASLGHPGGAPGPGMAVFMAAQMASLTGSGVDGLEVDVEGAVGLGMSGMA